MQAQGKQFTFAGLQDEGNAVPSLVLDVDCERTESGATAVLGNGVIIQIARFAAIQRLSVLSDNDVFGLNGRNTTQHSNLDIA